ncbi:MAG: 5-(carboxyamino)imidazole ribonucleotide synthase [Flavobacteriaceae bacterium]|nr:MAG: 5-(carboxyamino)imidazole ribonucleotide synthase [Flavobacteriaceae bacterium]
MKIGILGGGQLGRMFLQNALNYPVEISILDPSPLAPCKNLAHQFTLGDFNDFQTVIDFGKDLDVIGIEIEHVNTSALIELKKMGKKIIPDPEVLEIIKDKGLQKAFYAKHQIPTAPFVLLEENEPLTQHESFLPCFQKLRTGGYDGKGVLKINSVDDPSFSAPCVLEKAADLQKEIAVVVVQDQKGNRKAYPAIEMVANPKYNLLDYLLCPAEISDEIQTKAIDIALLAVEKLGSAGIFAVELFLNKDQSIWVNEIAPRVHNSGHSTIEGAFCSQFDQMLRILAGYPLGSTKLKGTSVMLNLIGEENFSGEAYYLGVQQALELENTYLHLYGKKQTSKGRKMGHITLVGNSKEELLPKIDTIKENLKVISKS